MRAKRQRYRNRAKTNSKKKRGLTKILAFFLIFAFVSVYILLSSDFWDGKNKLPLVIAEESGDISIAVFDPDIHEVTIVIIPGDTVVRVARGLGTLKIKNVIKLGENEGLSGKLLAETITFHFKLPVAAWSEHGANGFLDSNIITSTKSALTRYKTNLTLGDRIRLAIFSLSIQNADRVEINLATTGFLTQKTLIDGEEGFVITGNIPTNLIVIFSDPEIAKYGSTVLIHDATSRPNIAQEFGEVIEVLGAKIAAVEQAESENFDCVVQGKDQEIVRKVARLFSCTIEGETLEKNFDLQIKLGEEFAKRF